MPVHVHRNGDGPMKRKFAFLLNNWRGDRRGSVSVLSVGIFVLVVTTGGVALQTGMLYQAQEKLQTSANIAALAGASQLFTSASSAVTTANSYMGSNMVAGQTPSAATGYPLTKCLTSTGVSCAATGANAIVVKNTVSMNLLLGGLFGKPTETLSATATASASGGVAKAADVVLIIDNTELMTSKDSSCSISGNSELACALAGARNMLLNFNPSTTNVALMVFPGLSNPSVDYCGKSGSPTTVSYKTAGATPSDYLVLGFSNDYKTSNTATTLNTSSNLVKAVGGVSGCAGLQANGGYGTYYAGVIAEAQAYLTNSGRAGAEKIILFLSDGDANASSSNVPAGMGSNQCHEGIAAAQAATAAGMTVYTAAYGSPTALQTASCSTDTKTPAVSACTSMQQMASNAGTFFPVNLDGAGTCTSTTNTNTDASTALDEIGASINVASGGARLVLNSTD